MKDILAAITTYREERGWTEYQLAEHSGLPQSTISSWYRKNMVPTIPSLEKICVAFGITLSQLFAEGDNTVSLTESQQKLLDRWARLSEEQQAVVFALIDKMYTHTMTVTMQVAAMVFFFSKSIDLFCPVPSNPERKGWD